MLIKIVKDQEIATLTLSDQEGTPGVARQHELFVCLPPINRKPPAGLIFNPITIKRKLN